MDAVCVSFVRSTTPRAGELLDDESRFNVAITRAKKKLILIGDAETLKSSPVIGRAIDFYRAGMDRAVGADAVHFAPRARRQRARVRPLIDAHTSTHHRILTFTSLHFSSTPRPRAHARTD